MNRIRGYIIWFDRVKGYGFLEGEDKKEYFVHFRNIDSGGRGKRYVEPGNHVLFEPSLPFNAGKGPVALHITLEHPSQSQIARFHLVKQEAPSDEGQSPKQEVDNE